MTVRPISSRSSTGALDELRELNREAWAICKKDALGALDRARQAQTLLADCPEATPTDEFECLKTQTYCLDVLGKPEEALPIGVQASHLAERLGDKYLIGSIQSLLGRVYWHVDDYPASMDIYLQALKMVETEHYPDLEVSLINGLGLVQYGLGQYSEALGYFKTCLEKAGEDDVTGRADASNNIAYVLHMLGRDQEALEYDKAALALFTTLGTTVGKMETLHSLGCIYAALGNYEQAMGVLEEGLALARQIESPVLEIAYILEISRIHRVSGRAGQAADELLDALRLAEGVKSLTNISLIHERLIEIYKDQQQYKLALDHFEAFHAVYTQIFNDRSDRRVKYLEIVNQVESARQQAERYREQAGTDALTGLVNRRRFWGLAEAALEQMRRDQGQVAILMLDIDDFKKVNDVHGHQCGDEVLSVVAASLRTSLRADDVAGRYGGDEFVVLVAGLSSDRCQSIAERIRQSVAEQAVQVGEAVVRATLSLGLAWIDAGRACPLDALVNEADQALYLAKQQGRNRVVVWTHDEHAMAQ